MRLTTFQENFLAHWRQLAGDAKFQSQLLAATVTVKELRDFVGANSSLDRLEGLIQAAERMRDSILPSSPSRRAAEDAVARQYEFVDQMRTALVQEQIKRAEEYEKTANLYNVIFSLLTEGWMITPEAHESLVEEAGRGEDLPNQVFFPKIREPIWVEMPPPHVSQLVQGEPEVPPIRGLIIASGQAVAEAMQITIRNAPEWCVIVITPTNDLLVGIEYSGSEWGLGIMGHSCPFNNSQCLGEKKGKRLCAQCITLVECVINYVCVLLAAEQGFFAQEEEAVEELGGRRPRGGKDLTFKPLGDGDRTIYIYPHKSISKEGSAGGGGGGPNWVQRAGPGELERVKKEVNQKGYTWRTGPNAGTFVSSYTRVVLRKKSSGGSTIIRKGKGKRNK